MIQLSSDYNDALLRRANRGACALALAAGLAVRSTCADLPKPFDKLHYSRTAELLVMAAVGPLQETLTMVGQAMRLARCEGLIVQPSTTRDGRLTLDLTAGLWSARGNQWHHDLRAFVDGEHAVWLVPNFEVTTGGPSFRLRPARLLPEAAPWLNVDERDAGLALADRLFAEER